MIKHLKRLLYLDSQNLDNSREYIWKKSCLRIVSIGILFLVAGIGIDIVIRKISEGYIVLAAVITFSSILMITLSILSARWPQKTTAVYLFLAYLLAVLIVLVSDSSKDMLLIVVFTFSTPLLARILYGMKSTLFLMALNTLLFLLLNFSYIIHPGITDGIPILNRESSLYITSLIFIFMNFLLPLMVSRLIYALVKSSDNIVDLNERLIQNENLYKSVFENAATAAVICNSEGIILRVNKGVEELTGYTREELEEQRAIDELLDAHAIDRSKSSESLYIAHTGNHDFDTSVFEFNLTQKNGDIKYVLVRFGILIDNGMYIVSIFDFTKNRATEAELEQSRKREEYLRKHDSMTGLPSRSHFRELVDIELSKIRHTGAISSVISIGLDRFKYINDKYGIEVGDYIIKDYAERLKGVLRTSDLVGRLGGDVFVCLINNIRSHDEFFKIMSQKRMQFPRMFECNGLSIEVTSSMGISFFPNDSIDADTLLRHSEMALDQAKRSSQGSTAIYNSEIEAKMSQKFKIEADLKNAIRDKKLFLNYQPKVDYSGAIVGFEALVRWISDDGTYVSPATFIPAAEEMGIIYLIDKLIIDTVCEHIACWQNMYGICFPVSVNLSAKNLSIASVLDYIVDTVKKHKISPACLEIEITETGIMENETAALTLLHKLIQSGFSITIDDFGTGYSSLNKLKDFPVNTIKIDKSFVDEIPGNPRAEKIVKTIISLAQNLNFQLVAEGVENESQAEFLNNLGCSTFQGYLYYKPLPEMEIQDLFKSMSKSPNSTGMTSLN